MSTGTVYALVDPRDGKLRYIGQTRQPLAQRLRGHLGRPASAVGRWIEELRAADLQPQIVAIRVNVPVEDLRAAECEEIIRIIGAGDVLLNDQSTAEGRELNRLRLVAECEAAWRQVAEVAFGLLGGPVPPGVLPQLPIPDFCWQFMSAVPPDHLERVRSLLSRPQEEGHEERYRTWRECSREIEMAETRLTERAHSAFGEGRRAGGDLIDRWMDETVPILATTPCSSRADASRFLCLMMWYGTAVHPWRHLAKLAGVPLDDASFIQWAGRDEEVKDALAFLASRGERMLERLAPVWRSDYREPGFLLGAVVVAYAGVEAPAEIRDELKTTFGTLAKITS